MSDDYNARVNAGDSLAYTSYTYADIMAGAPVRFDKAKYSQVGYAFSGIQYIPIDVIKTFIPDFFTQVNEVIWLTMNPSLVSVLNTSQVGLCSDVANPCDSFQNTFDYSLVLTVLSSVGGDEFIVPLFGTQIPAIPDPRPFWLVASGLLLVTGAVHRKQKRSI